jgi:nucleoside-diphosphate-sugar epimerase
MGWHAAPAPKQAVDATAALVAHLPFLPDRASWVEAIRRPVLMDSSRARKKLSWRPEHDAHETLRETVAAHRSGQTT